MPRSSDKNLVEQYPSRVARRTTIAKAKLAAGTVTVCGRVVSRDTHAGAVLLVVADASGSVTCVLPAPSAIQLFDIVEATGKVSGHRLQVSVVRCLATARRQPKGDSQWQELVRNPKGRDLLARRSQAMVAIRSFFSKQGFLEVDTPSLVAAPGMEPYLSPFTTTLVDEKGKKQPAYLITSPEYSLKKLLVAGFENIFDLAHVFRNGEELGKTHNPEFIMLEWYRAFASYAEIMDDCEALLPAVAKAVTGSATIRCRGASLDLAKPWERLTVAEAFARFAAVDLDKVGGRDDLFKIVREKGYRPAEKERYEDLFFRIFLNEVEPCLGQQRPMILRDYPIELAALAKQSAADPRYAERFEIYVGGLELANGYTELNDPLEQRRRLVAEQSLRRKLKKPVLPIDEDFLAALEVGMPPAGGVALGVDRLVMLLTDTANIDDVRFLPASTLFRRSDINKPNFPLR